MFAKNKELRWDLTVLLAASALLMAVGFSYSLICGVLIAAACGVTCGMHLLIEAHRYRRLRKISEELDELLSTGTPLKIRQYEEGELSILANQIEKITLRLQESADALSKEKKVLSDSLADISHQLRTPLTAMNLTAAMLRNPDLTPEKRNSLCTDLSRLLERTGWLVETLLKLSRFDAGTVTMNREPVSIRSLLKRAAEPLQIPMELREQKLELLCAEEEVCIDRCWTAEALGNVLKNAMEHTHTGGTIRVSAVQTPLFTQITVEDTGPGFDKKDLSHLFERFYKGKNASPEGYGIGLALARSIICAQNGTISASNGKNGGIFTLRFYR